MKFKSLWQGPSIDDGVMWEPSPGATFFSRWCSTGLYALDEDGQPWTLAIENTADGSRRFQWMSVEALTGGSGK